ncbi:hypothetical protein ABZ137_19675 [Streptomyces bobili]
MLVAALARTWGVDERDVGKTVWAELPLRAQGETAAKPSRVV